MSQPQIYVIRHYRQEFDLCEYYKIGVAENPQRRLTELKAGTPFNLELVATLSSEDAEKVEQELHRMLVDQCKNREWFSLTPQQIEFFKTNDRITLSDISNMARPAPANDFILGASDYTTRGGTI